MYAPPPPMYAGPRQSNAWAIVGFVLSIVGLGSCVGILCFPAYLVGVFAPIGLILSCIGMRRPHLRGLAIAGLVIGILGTLAAIGGVVMTIIFFAAASSNGGQW